MSIARKPLCQLISASLTGTSIVIPRSGNRFPAAEQQIAEWQAALEALLLVVELNGPTMTARISVLRALNRHLVREFNSSRKDTHWGRQKLARDR